MLALGFVRRLEPTAPLVCPLCPQTSGYYGAASSANSFGSGNMDSLGMRGGYGLGNVAADAGYAGVSLSSLRDRGDRIATRYRSGEPFDIMR